MKDIDKPLIVSGILLALREAESGSFEIDKLKCDEIDTDGEKIFNAIRPVRKLKRQSVYGFEDVLISARLDVIIRARDSYC